MKILCTGGAGFLGSILVPELLRVGHIVCVLDNFMYHQTPLLDKCMSDNLTIVNHDVTDDEFMIKFYKEFDLVIPLACWTGAPTCQQNKTYAEAVIMTAAKELGWLNHDIKIIYPTTNSGYGIGGEEYCTEKSELKPISLYGKWKCEAERLILNRGNAISLRLATAFGVSPRMRLDLMVNNFVYKAINDSNLVIFEGHFRRNFVHVRDIAKAITHCIDNWDNMKDNVYNVGDTKANMTKVELAQKIKEYIPNLQIIEAKIGEDPDKRDYIVSNEKLEKTGWKPFYTIDDGIKELIKAYKIIKQREFSNV